jgi:hypothetical protein
MKRFVLSALLLLSASGHATDIDSPLAVTAHAAVQGALSPTAADQALSQQYLSKGLDCLKLGHANAAVQALLDSVRLAPGADNTKALGTAYYQVGNLPKAAWAYQQSLQWRPDARVRSLLDQLQTPAPGAAAVVGAPTVNAAAPAKTPAPRGHEAAP